ncbi:MAG: hypothetical protein ABR568_23710, partial [Pyrinomonadaceae bacterium]
LNMMRKEYKGQPFGLNDQTQYRTGSGSDRTQLKRLCRYGIEQTHQAVPLAECGSDRTQLKRLCRYGIEQTHQAVPLVECGRYRSRFSN